MKNLILVSMFFIFIGCSDTKEGSETKIQVQNENLVIEKVEQKSEVIESVKGEIIDKPIIEAKDIYSVCSSCHGVNAEKKALNVSNVLQGQSKEEIIKKLNGYRDGTYGGPMKGVMNSQVKTLSSEKIEAVAEYISKL